MIYRIYCSSGNNAGIDEYVSYSEIDSDGYWRRYVEIKSSGKAIRYTQLHAADIHGVLPEGTWNEHEASLSEYGTTVEISAELFNAVWATTRCLNEL